jgi:serine protease DegQ
VKSVVPLVLAAILVAGCTGDDETAEPAPPTVTQTRTETVTATPALGGGEIEGIPELVRRVSPSVVAVVLENGEGSGVIWSEDGTIVTNNHVVSGTSTVDVVFATGERVEADVMATDPLTDLAVIQAGRDGLPAAEFSDRLPAVGELAVAIGNPLGFEGSVTAGIVSGLHRRIPTGSPEGLALVDLMQTDAPISPGNSGGALVDGDGRVIGINVAYIPPAGGAVSLGFAIPGRTVVDIVEQLLEDGEAQHSFLGVEPRELTPEVVDQFGLETGTGVLVFAVEAGSAAARAGLRAGDVIVSVDGEEMTRVEDLFAVLRQRSPGDRVTLAIVRNGEELEVTAVLTDRPES